MAAGSAAIAAVALLAFDAGFADGAVGFAGSGETGETGADSPAETLGVVTLTIFQTTGYRHVFQPIETAASINPNNVIAGLGISFPFSPTQHLAA
jgi:hypothetical protein